MLKSFLAFNRKLSKKITPAHFDTSGVFENFLRCGALLMAMPDVNRVLDVGAGKSWHFPPEYKTLFDLHITGVDIDLSEMDSNSVLDVRLEGDATKSLIVPPASVDLVTVFSGVEHFENNADFLSLAYTALRPGGRLIAQFPGSLAPFALINSVLPQRFKEKTLNLLVPGSQGVLGFPAHYDRTRFSSFSAIAKQAGFEVEFHIPGYFSSGYFAFFFPLYIISLSFDLLRFSIGIRDLSSYNMFVLKKDGPAATIAWR